MIAKFRGHSNRETAQNRKNNWFIAIWLFISLLRLLFLSGVLSKFGGLADFWLLLQLTREVHHYQLMREQYDFIHHLQGVRSGLDSFRIFSLFVYVFIAWYIRYGISAVIYGFHVFLLLFFEFPNVRKCYLHVLLASRK